MIFVSDQTHEVKEIAAAMDNGAAVKPWRVDANGVRWFTLDEPRTVLRGILPDFLPAVDGNDNRGFDDEE